MFEGVALAPPPMLRLTGLRGKSEEEEEVVVEAEAPPPIDRETGLRGASFESVEFKVGLFGRGALACGGGGKPEDL